MFRKHVIHSLSAYLDWEVAALEYAHVESHLRDCSRCRAALLEIRFGSQVASSVSKKTAPQMIWRDIETARTKSLPSLSWIQVGAAIAGVAAILALSTSLNDLRPV